MELFKKKNNLNKALDILTNALHNDEISSFIVLVKKEKSTVVTTNGDLFSQAVSLVTARRNEAYRRIEELADIMDNVLKKDNGREQPDTTENDPW